MQKVWERSCSSQNVITAIIEKNLIIVIQKILIIEFKRDPEPAGFIFDSKRG
jgi:hypothetical protein